MTYKHPIMENKENVVKQILSYPDEIRQSQIHPNIYLFYKNIERLYCVVMRKINGDGFLITTYPTDKIKEGEQIWIK